MNFRSVIAMKYSWILLTLASIVTTLSAAAASPADDARTAAAGIRKLPGQRLTLYTDLSGPEIDRLPAIFDEAFPQWCRYFGVKEDSLEYWHVTACLMKSKASFTAAGLLPGNLPPFLHGYSEPHGRKFWLLEQPSDFYRRELFLHEGTHCFMFTVLKNAGAPWYKEGMAEYFGTYQWRDGQLTLGHTPRSREESAGWGRVRTIQDLVSRRRALRLGAVVELPDSAFLETEPYAWCWAAVTLLDRHPRYQQRFRQLIGFVRDRDFNKQFYRLFQPDWQELCEEWQLMVTGMEYGYDVAREAVDFTPGKPLPPSGTEIAVAADRGWQNSGLRLEAGATYRLTAAGRYQVAKTTKVWWCEPGGVSIRYYKGRPLGVLLASVRPDHPTPGSTTALLHSTVVGLGTTLSPAQTGTLFLKINDSAGELDDNAGTLKVDVRRE
jgi:hypothetical protein